MSFSAKAWNGSLWQKAPPPWTEPQMGTGLAGFTCPSLQPPKRDDRKLELDLHSQKEMLHMERDWADTRSPSLAM